MKVKVYLTSILALVLISGVSQVFAAGYFNTTTALTRVQFKMSSGNIDAGVIKMYGVS